VPRAPAVREAGQAGGEGKLDIPHSGFKQLCEVSFQCYGLQIKNSGTISGTYHV
jgi:hypothetical protein